MHNCGLFQCLHPFCLLRLCKTFKRGALFCGFTKSFVWVTDLESTKYWGLLKASQAFQNMHLFLYFAEEYYSHSNMFFQGISFGCFPQPHYAFILNFCFLFQDSFFRRRSFLIPLILEELSSNNFFVCLISFDNSVYLTMVTE